MLFSAFFPCSNRNMKYSEDLPEYNLLITKVSVPNFFFFYYKLPYRRSSPSLPQCCFSLLGHSQPHTNMLLCLWCARKRKTNKQQQQKKHVLTPLYSFPSLPSFHFPTIFFERIVLMILKVFFCSLFNLFQSSFCPFHSTKIS